MLSLQPFDIGCEPSPSVTWEILIQDGWSTFLIFFAVSQSVDETGFLIDKGSAVLECVNCESTIFGPDRSAWHPLCEFGLTSLPTNVIQVVNSPWVNDALEIYQGGLNLDDPESANGVKEESQPKLKHFIIRLREMTFECLATDMVVKRFFRTHGGASRYVRKQIAKHSAFV